MQTLFNVPLAAKAKAKRSTGLPWIITQLFTPGHFAEYSTPNPARKKFKVYDRDRNPLGYMSESVFTYLENLDVLVGLTPTGSKDPARFRLDRQKVRGLRKNHGLKVSYLSWYSRKIEQAQRQGPAAMAGILSGRIDTADKNTGEVRGLVLLSKGEALTILQILNAQKK